MDKGRHLQWSLQCDHDVNHRVQTFHVVTTSLTGSRTMPLARYIIAPRSKVDIPRKKRSSPITSAFGVEAAPQHLVHGDIRTKSRHRSS